MVAVQYALRSVQIAGMIFQTRSKSRVNSNKIADSGVVDHEVWKDKNRRWISGFYQTYDVKTLYGHICEKREQMKVMTDS